MEIEFLSQSLQPFILFQLLAFNWEIGFLLIFLVILLLCSGLVSGSEIAYFSLSPDDMEKIRSEGSQQSKLIIKLKEKPQSLLATILISNNFINVGIVILSDFILWKLIPEVVFKSWASGIQAFSIFNRFSLDVLAHGINFLITVVLVTFLLVLFGEVLPKIYANINNINLSKRMAHPLNILSVVFRPFSHLMVRWSNRFERRIEKRKANNVTNIKGELDKAIELTMDLEEKVNKPEEADMLKSILTFNDVSVKQIMVPRVDVVALDNTDDYSEVMKIVQESGFSRIPIIKEEFDSVVGILYAKDLLDHLDKKKGFNWQKLVRKNIFFVPESKKINDLLKEFQKRRLHMAIVVDEYGGSAGIVTMEDIMEEILGEIKDEFDSQIEDNTVKIDDNTFIFDGKTLINDVCRVIGEDILVFDQIKGDSDSIAGMILEINGKLPQENFTFSHSQFKFEVLSVTKRRIEKIRLTITPRM